MFIVKKKEGSLHWEKSTGKSLCLTICIFHNTMMEQITMEKIIYICIKIIKIPLVRCGAAGVGVGMFLRKRQQRRATGSPFSRHNVLRGGAQASGSEPDILSLETRFGLANLSAPISLSLYKNTTDWNSVQ